MPTHLLAAGKARDMIIQYPSESYEWGIHTEDGLLKLGRWKEQQCVSTRHIKPINLRIVSENECEGLGKYQAMIVAHLIIAQQDAKSCVGLKEVSMPEVQEMIINPHNGQDLCFP